MIWEGGIGSLLFAFGSLLALLYWYLTKDFDYWRKRHVVSLPAWPIFGSKGEILRFKKHVCVVNDEAYKKYSENKLIGGFKGSIPELIVCDPDLIRTILVKDFDHFNNRGFYMDAKTDPLTQHLFFLNGDKWKNMRQKITPIFTSAKIKNMFPLILECSQELQSFIGSMQMNGTSMEIRELMVKFTLDSIGACAFGLNMLSKEKDIDSFRKISGQIMKTSYFFKTLVRIFAPKLFALLKLKMTLQTVEDYFITLCKGIIKSRDSSSSRRDLIDLMLELRLKGKISEPGDGTPEEINQSDSLIITDEIIAAQAFVFFVAGFETSSGTMSYALHELAVNPSIQERVQEEIETVINKYDGKITYEGVKEMPYLDMFVSETLRKYPPGVVLNRVCEKAYTFPNSQLKIDKGVVVTVPVYSLHRDPKYFPDPERFIPERFTQESIQSKHPFVYLPFGEGPRHCIGLRFGKLQVAVGLISVLQHYRVVPNSKTVANLQITPLSVTLKSKSGIWLDFVPKK